MVAPPVTREKGFPRELLAGSVKERLEYFHEYKVYHPRLLDVEKALLRAIHYPAGALLIFLFGPPSVGKTTLLLHIIERLLKEAQPALEQNPGRLLLIYLQAPPPDKPRFTWVDFYTEYLLAADEPLIDYKIDLDRRAAEQSGKAQKLPRGQERTQDLRRAVLKMLFHRQPGVVLVDEAQHIGQGIGSMKLRDQLDCLKSLASESKVVHVLLGPYELIEMRNVSAQLGWRSRDIHFSRYHVENPEDRKTFQAVLKAFQKQMPLEQTPNLVQHWRFLAEGSIGCVGKLKQWLEDALTVALEENKPTLLKEHLEATEPSLESILTSATDAAEGEGKLLKTPEKLEALRRALGYKGQSAATDKNGDKAQTPDQEETDASKTQQDHTQGQRSRRGNVGERRPEQRDPTQRGKHAQ